MVLYKINGLRWMQTDPVAVTLISFAQSIPSALYINSEHVVVETTVIGRQAAVVDIESRYGPAIAEVSTHRGALNLIVKVQELIRKLLQQAAGMVAFEQTGLQIIAPS